MKFICIGTITEKIAENILNIDAKAENIIYGIAKHTTHCLLDVLCKKIQLPYVWARLSNIYGGDNTTGNIISYMLSELRQGKRPMFSKAEEPYDLMYVVDAVRALYLIGVKSTNENCYFVGSGEPRLLKEYLILIKNIFGKGAMIGLGERPEDGLRYHYDWFDTSALERDTGFKVQNNFEVNIKYVIEGNSK
jgi:nucleoside-diphosphate-sugar epimerase